MAVYRAIVDFCDLEDNGHYYRAGETFPRSGVIVSEERVAYLAGGENRMGYPLIEREKKSKKTADKAE